MNIIIVLRMTLHDPFTNFKSFVVSSHFFSRLT